MEENQILIPEGWRKEELGSFFTEKPKSNLKVSDAANFGPYPFFTSGEAVFQHNTKQLDGRHIFLATGGVANVKYYDGEAAYSTDTYTVGTKEKIDTRFLYYGLLNIIDYINANYFEGSGLKHLQKKEFKRHLFLYPEDSEEQQTIASILSKTDEAIAETEKLIAKYNRIKTGLMQDLLTKGIDENGNIRSEETHEFKDSPLGRIPKEWDTTAISKLCLKIVDCKNRTSPFVEKSEYPVIRTSNIKNGALVWEDMKYTDPQSYKIWTQRAVPQEDDVIITREAPLGQTVKIPSGLTPVLGQRTMLYRTNPEKLLPDFLVSSIMNERMQKYLNSISGGSTVHHLKVGEMKEFLVAVPIDVKEQEKIISSLNNVQEYIDTHNSKREKLQRLKVGLMQDLLSGKVRINYTITPNQSAS